MESKEFRKVLNPLESTDKSTNKSTNKYSDNHFKIFVLDVHLYSLHLTHTGHSITFKARIIFGEGGY